MRKSNAITIHVADPPTRLVIAQDPDGTNQQRRPSQFFISLSSDIADAEMFGNDFAISRLAIPAVSILVSFLAYTSQYFFLHFEPVPLRKDEVWKINIFALCIWVCYLRSCYVDPGRLPASQKNANTSPEEKAQATRRQRWCRRCEAYKPPRAHHCKACQRLGSKPI